MAEPHAPATGETAGAFSIPPEHPALPGHFPGHPVVPGALLLDHILLCLAEAAPDYPVLGLARVKFLAPVLPGQCVCVRFQRNDARLDFVGSVGALQVLRGMALRA
jgi:3-hydroxymyristoyl/3-hydroxydecanoyl-(acyl carrier protein) dehydratase